MTQVVEPVEAVIISGPRRGEIVRLPEDAIPGVSNEEVQLLSQALDLVEAAIDRLEAEVQATTEAIRTPGLESQVADVRERLAWLEAYRDADRAQMLADLAQFKLDVERAELRPGSAAAAAN